MIGNHIARVQIPNGLLNVLDRGQPARAGRIHGILELGFELLDEPMCPSVGASQGLRTTGESVKRGCGG